MSKEQTASDIEESDMEEVQEEIRKINRSWYQNPWLFIVSLILAPATFVGAFYLNPDSIWQSAVQSIVFLISAGFFVLVLSYVFNITWIYVNKEKTYKHQIIHSFLQIGALVAIIIIFVLNVPHVKEELLRDVFVFRIYAIVYQILIYVLSITSLLSFIKVFKTENRTEMPRYSMIGIAAGLILGAIVFFGLYYLTKYSVNFVFS